MSATTALVPCRLLHELAVSAQAVGEGKLTEDAFKPLRLSAGAHRQRLGDGYMLRVRVPGGRLSLDHFAAVADVAAACASRAHLTLRQDLQLYHVGLDQVAKAACELAEQGLSTYASGGSTVRNVTCGILGDQDPACAFDPYPYAAALSARLSRHPLFNALPRKFKIGFGGPGREQAQGWLNDLGFLPLLRHGQRGFRLIAGGGLGASPQNGVEIEPFIAAEMAGPFAEAALEFFAAVSDPAQPTSNRFKFTLRALGAEAVRQAIHDRLTGKPLDGRLGAGDKPLGSSLWIEAPLGDLSPLQLQGLASALRPANAKELRLSFDQRLYVPGLAEAALPGLIAECTRLGLPASPLPALARLVVCTGPQTCNRGLVNSKALGQELQHLDLPVSLHISGCQNGCSQHLTAPLSLQGTVKAGKEGRIPSYVLRAASHSDGAGIHFGPVLLTLPARRVKAGLEQLLSAWMQAASGSDLPKWLVAMGSGGLEALLQAAAPEGGDIRFDCGSEKAFEVALGGSECH